MVQYSLEVMYFYSNFLLSHSKDSDVNIGIIAILVHLEKIPLPWLIFIQEEIDQCEEKFCPLVSDVLFCIIHNIPDHNRYRLAINI